MAAMREKEKSQLIAEKNEIKYKVLDGAAEDLVLKFVRVENMIPNESNEVTAPQQGFTENVVENINDGDIEETKFDVITIDDDTSDSETAVAPHLIQRVSLVNGTGPFDKGEEGAMHSCTAMNEVNISELKQLLRESEEKLENNKIKLADIERRNAKKKFVIMKGEKKIKDLEEIIKTRDSELSIKNEFISRLQKEKDNLLNNLKACLEYVSKVPEIFEGVSNQSISNNMKFEDGDNGNSDPRNTYEEVVEKKEETPDVLGGESVALSEFLSMIAKVKKHTSDVFKNEKRGDVQEIYNADVVITTKDEDLNDPLTTINSGKRNLVVKEDEDNNILIPTVKHLPTSPLEDGLSTHSEITPSPRFKPFASVSAKSSNSVGSKSKKRKVYKS